MTIIGIIILVFVVMGVVFFFLFRGMQQPGAVQEVEEPETPPAEEQADPEPGADAGDAAEPLFPAEGPFSFSQVDASDQPSRLQISQDTTV